jgi:hypothetical protein
VLFFPTVPSANTLVRWVNESAFVSIVQTRPCPTFGRPVHLRGSPHRLRPGSSPHAFRIPSRDGHPALRRTNFILRPARHYPRFWIWPSSSECQKDFNLPEQRAAQHTLWGSPTLRLRIRTLALVVASTCGFSVGIGVSGSHVPLNRLFGKLRPPLMPDAAPPVSRFRRS